MEVVVEEYLCFFGLCQGDEVMRLLLPAPRFGFDFLLLFVCFFVLLLCFIFLRSVLYLRFSFDFEREFRNGWVR